MFTHLIVWVLNIARKILGHALLAPEEVQNEIHEKAVKREQKRIMEAKVEVEDTAKDLDNGVF